jgi:hypothetical protein
VKIAFFLFTFFLGSYAFSQTDVITISAPLGGVLSPTTGSIYNNGVFPATAAAVSSAGYHITGWRVYVDHVQQYQINNTYHINTFICTTEGSHYVKITAWDASGNYNSYAAYQVNVTGSCDASSPGSLVIPSTALLSDNLDQRCNSSSTCYGGWKVGQDANGGGLGVTTGSSSSVTSSAPPRSGATDSNARLFDFMFSGGWADERYSVHVPQSRSTNSDARDITSTNFVYDTWIYLDHPEDVYALEFDVDQVVPSNAIDYVVIYGIQCNLDKNVWQIADGNTRVNTNLTCQRKNFSANQWHHIQLYFQRDGLKSVFNSVTIDGNYQEFLTSNGTHPEGNDYYNYGWPSGILLLNYQLDSLGDSYLSGGTKSYFENLKLYRW